MPNDGGLNKRKHRRTLASFAARYSVKSPFEERLSFGEKEMDAIADDLSEGGLSLLTDYPLPIGTGIIIRFRLSTPAAAGEEGSRKFELQAESRYCAPTKDKSYRVGIRFMNLTQADRDFLKNTSPLGP